MFQDWSDMTMPFRFRKNTYAQQYFEFFEDVECQADNKVANYNNHVISNKSMNNNCSRFISHQFLMRPMFFMSNFHTRTIVLAVRFLMIRK